MITTAGTRIAAARAAALALALAAGGLLAASPALAYGPEGHLVAGMLAEPLLCEKTTAEIAALGGGDELPEIGLWADRIRSDDAWRHTGPWHYMNIDDRLPIESFEHPEEGDVLWAIDHYSRRLAAGRRRADRSEALRFLVHFVVDVHQPLHVGLEADRGGNTIDVRVDGKTVNLHRFWDTEALHLDGLSLPEYAASLEPLVRAALAANADQARPAAWADESLDLRPAVYAFAPAGSSPPGDVVLDERYVDRARSITRERLARAAVRLAATLNQVLAQRTRC